MLDRRALWLLFGLSFGRTHDVGDELLIGRIGSRVALPIRRKDQVFDHLCKVGREDLFLAEAISSLCTSLCVVGTFWIANDLVEPKCVLDGVGIVRSSLNPRFGESVQATLQVIRAVTISFLYSVRDDE